MSDETSESRGLTECSVFRGEDGSLYVLSQELLDAHRIPPEEAQAALEALEAQTEVAGFASQGFGAPRAGEFQLVVRAPFELKGPPVKPFVPTASTWWDAT